jgi:hypothetical protein
MTAIPISTNVLFHHTRLTISKLTPEIVRRIHTTQVPWLFIVKTSGADWT